MKVDMKFALQIPLVLVALAACSTRAPVTTLSGRPDGSLALETTLKGLQETPLLPIRGLLDFEISNCGEYFQSMGFGPNVEAVYFAYSDGDRARIISTDPFYLVVEVDNSKLRPTIALNKEGKNIVIKISRRHLRESQCLSR